MHLIGAELPTAGGSGQSVKDSAAGVDHRDVRQVQTITRVRDPHFEVLRRCTNLVVKHRARVIPRKLAATIGDVHTPEGSVSNVSGGIDSFDGKRVVAWGADRQSDR